MKITQLKQQTIRGVAYSLLLLVLCAVNLPVFAHHVLGRPSYSLNEDSNTPPSKQFETRIGKFYITYMAFPAFPKPGERGRVNVYIKRVKDGAPFNGKVTFVVRDDSWFAGNEEKIGEQPNDESVYRQGFEFKQAGNYIISARFFADNEPYVIDFPLTIGNPGIFRSMGALVLSLFIAVLVALLIGVNVLIKRKLIRLKTSRNLAEDSGVKPTS